MDILQAITIFTFGLCIGSFLNVVTLRLPNNKKLSGRSRCPGCERVLGAGDLVPVLSYVFLGGKCRGCKKPISFRYPLVEVVTGCLFLCAWLVLRPENMFEYIVLTKGLIFISVMLAVFVIDLEHYLILDNILIAGGLPIAFLNLILDQVSGTPFWSSSSAFFGGWVAGLASAAIFYLLWLVSRGKWMGYGDVKYMLFLGLALGWPVVWPAWLGAFFLGTLFAIPLLIVRRKQLSSQLPFGTFLSLSAFLAWVWGEKVIVWYLELIGLG